MIESRTIIKNETPELTGQAAGKNDGAREAIIGKLFETENPLQFRTDLLSLLNDNRDNLEILEGLADLVDKLDREIRPRAGAGDEKQKQESGISRIRALYAGAPFNKKKVTFLNYVYEFLVERAAGISRNYKEYRELRAQQAGQREMIKQQKEREARIAELVPIIRDELLKEMRKRTLAAVRSAEHQQRISRAEADFQGEKVYRAKEERLIHERVHEEELLLAYIMERANLFGEGARISHTDRYDDIFTRVDFVVEIKDRPPVFVDLTHDSEHVGNNLYYNRQNPHRALVYPPNENLKNKLGIPVVIGMAREDAKESIDLFLRQLAGQRIENKPDVVDEEKYKESLEQWVEQILLQLRSQYSHIYESLDLAPKEQMENYQIALEEYERCIEYFEKIKKGRQSSGSDERRPRYSVVSAMRPWNRKMNNIEGTVKEYELRQGVAETAPNLGRVA